MIAFDIDFAEPDRTSPKIAAAFACQKRVGTEKAEELLAALPDPDQRLVEAMAEAPVVTGFILTDRGEARPPLPKAGFALVGTIRPVKLPSGGGFEFDPLGQVDSFPPVVPNLPGLEAAAAGDGFLNQFVDWDHVVRRIPAARFLASVYDLYRHRIAQFQIGAPPANGNGVFTAEEK